MVHLEPLYANGVLFQSEHGRWRLADYDSRTR
jgi:hypothetical protein